MMMLSSPLEKLLTFNRLRGYNPEGGDWWWGKFKPNGEPFLSPDGKMPIVGKVKGCIGCHSVQKNKDWLFSEPK
jgi:hypothetical protein